MKNIIIVSILILSTHLKVQSQRFAYTGKAWSLGMSVQPVSSFYQKNDKLKINALSSSIALSKKIRKGFYPTLGYTYTKSNESVDLNPRPIVLNPKPKNGENYSEDSLWKQDVNQALDEETRLCDALTRDESSIIQEAEADEFSTNVARSEDAQG